MKQRPYIKGLFTAILFSFIITLSSAQENLSLNFGGTSQQNYFTEINYENVSEKLIIKVTLGGKEYRFLLDTGAPTLITKTLFDELKPATLDAATIKRLPVWDAGGNVDSLNVINLSGITIGNVVFNDIPTLVLKDQPLFDCLKVDGSIGSNMLRNSILHLSSKTRTIILTDQPHKLNLDSKTASDLYLNPTQSSPLVETKMLGKGSVSIPMLFDTGADSFVSIALYHYMLCEEHEIFSVLAKSEGSTYLSAFGAEKDTTKYRLRISEINIDGAIFKNATIETSTDENSSIGLDLLNYGTVTVDYKSKKFYFEPFQAAVDLYTGSFPVSITLKDRRAVIGIVWDQGLKDSIKVGDQLQSMDEQDYTRLSDCELLLTSGIFEGKTKASLTLRSPDGKIKKVTISRK